MMMIKSDAQAEAGTPPDQAMLTAMGKFNEEMAAAGVMLAGEGLQSSKKGARVRLANRKFTVVDGPFAEAKELVAGFWLVQAPSLQDAVGWAKRVPCVEDGEIELRRLWEMSDFPAADAPPSPAGQTGDKDWREFEGRFREEHGQGEPAPATAAPAAPPRKPGTTRFMVMLKSDTATESGNPPTEAALNQMGALMEELGEAGALLAGEGLRPSREGARVRFSGGKRTVLDGPFSESKEMIAGYTIIQVPALADAVAFARRWLTIHVETGVNIQASEIEIRQVHELSDFPADTSDGGWREREAKLREKLEGRQA
jgi:hypothetical protein